ncbi:MAG TPA: HAD hydrolase family protein [Halioglobus sp.]
MRYLAFATDYDGTLAKHGFVSEEVLKALKRVRETGRLLLLVTGRELEDLMRVFPDYAIFDRIVAENGALLYRPAAKEELVLGEAPPPALVQRLQELNVSPLSVGRVIVSTWSPNEQVVLETIHALGLELQVIFNKGAVMILPSGVNKASGLRVALGELSLSAHNALAIGDAENDHALIAECELGIAVANALPLLKERADWVTRGHASDGVCEIIEELVTNDLIRLQPRLVRHDLALGKAADGTAITLHPYGHRVLLCGVSGSGKSTLATSFFEALLERRYQFCLVDPEGDFDGVEAALVLGDQDKAPTIEEVASVLKSMDSSVIANLLSVPFDERNAFLVQLLARCSELRASTGRPHWFVVDEAHHMLPEGDVKLLDPIAHAPSGLLLITVHPQRIARSVLANIDTLIVVGEDTDEAVAAFAMAVGATVPDPASYEAPAAGHALIWRWQSEAPRSFIPAAPRHALHRHRRKYAAGALGEDKSFYFRGPNDQFNLRAQNLMLFLQIGDGVDDETWLYHLHQHDYSAWVRTAIKNDELADELEVIEREDNDALSSRKRVRSAIEKIYTLPGS